jgi:hypothetical protein
MVAVVARFADGPWLWAVRGAWDEHATHGLPLDVIFHRLADQRTVPDWADFVRDMIASGVKPSRIPGMLDHAVADAYGDANARKLITQLTRLLASC